MASSLVIYQAAQVMSSKIELEAGLKTINSLIGRSSAGPVEKSVKVAQRVDLPAMHLAALREMNARGREERLAGNGDAAKVIKPDRSLSSRATAAVRPGRSFLTSGLPCGLRSARSPRIPNEGRGHVFTFFCSRRERRLNFHGRECRSAFAVGAGTRGDDGMSKGLALVVVLILSTLAASCVSDTSDYRNWPTRPPSGGNEGGSRGGK